MFADPITISYYIYSLVLISMSVILKANFLKIPNFVPQITKLRQTSFQYENMIIFDVIIFAILLCILVVCFFTNAP